MAPVGSGSRRIYHFLLNRRCFHLGCQSNCPFGNINNPGDGVVVLILSTAFGRSSILIAVGGCLCAGARAGPGYTPSWPSSLRGLWPRSVMSVGLPTAAEPRGGLVDSMNAWCITRSVYEHPRHDGVLVSAVRLPDAAYNILELQAPVRTRCRGSWPTARARSCEVVVRDWPP